MNFILETILWPFLWLMGRHAQPKPQDDGYVALNKKGEWVIKCGTQWCSYADIEIWIKHGNQGPEGCVVRDVIMSAGITTRDDLNAGIAKIKTKVQT
jgi:hypothetical protein